MRKAIAVLCTAALLPCLLTSCGTSSAEDSRVELTKRGGVIEYTVGDFSASYYDADEFEEFVDEEISAYEESNDGRINVKKNKVKRDTAYLTIRYDAPETYAVFNGVECFSGSVGEALEEGYGLPEEFDPDGDESVRVFVVGTNVDVRVPGTVLYYSSSAGEAFLESSDTVGISVGEDVSGAVNVVCVLYE